MTVDHTMPAAFDILHKFGIRPSHQRLTVLSYMLEHRNHSSADEIYDALHQEIPVISRTTVYNTLRLFRDAGVVRTLSIGTNPLAFDAELTPHAHFYCTSCHSITDVPVQISDWERLKHYGGPGDSEMQVVFNGICRKCSNHS